MNDLVSNRLLPLSHKTALITLIQSMIGVFKSNKTYHVNNLRHRAIATAIAKVYKTEGTKLSTIIFNLFLTA